MEAGFIYLIAAVIITTILLAVTLVTLFLMQKNSFNKSNLEIKQIQLENLRFIQQMEKNNEKRQQENEKFFRSLSYSVGQIYLNLSDDTTE